MFKTIVCVSLLGMAVFMSGCSSVSATVGDWLLSASTYTAITDKAEAYAIVLANKKIDKLDLSDEQKTALKETVKIGIGKAFDELAKLKEKYDAAKKAKEVANSEVAKATTAASPATTATEAVK